MMTASARVDAVSGEILGPHEVALPWTLMGPGLRSGPQLRNSPRSQSAKLMSLGTVSLTAIPAQR